MTPAQAIAALDKQLAAHGEDVLLLRGNISIPCRGFVRAVKAEKVVGTITQQDWDVVISPTSLSGTAFPGVPRITDKVVYSVRGPGEKQIKKSEPIYLDGVLVRCNLVAAG